VDKATSAQIVALLAKANRKILENSIIRPKLCRVSWRSNPEIEKHDLGLRIQ
jgi:hypothetical protein